MTLLLFALVVGGIALIIRGAALATGRRLPPAGRTALRTAIVAAAVAVVVVGAALPRGGSEQAAPSEPRDSTHVRTDAPRPRPRVEPAEALTRVRKAAFRYREPRRVRLRNGSPERRHDEDGPRQRHHGDDEHSG